MNENFSRPASYDEFKSIIENKGGFVMAGWCGSEECEKKMKQDTGADIRVLPFDQDGGPEKCIYCGKDSKKAAIFARSY